MPSPYTVQIHCPKQKLIFFAETIYGAQPLILPKKDNLSKLVNMLLAKIPPDYKPAQPRENALTIQLNYYKDKDVRSYNYLSANSQKIIIDRIDDLFKLEFRRHVDKLLLGGLKNQLESAYSFMEAFNLPDSVLYDLLQDYQRYRSLLCYRDRKAKVAEKV